MNNTVSIGEAIDDAISRVHKPQSLIMRIAMLSALILLLIGWHLWWLSLTIIVLAVLSCRVLQMVVIPRWKLWAFSKVRNVHQLQRTAELEGILPLGGPSANHLLAGASLLHELEELLPRFEEDDIFEDDPAIPATTAIYRRRGLAKWAGFSFSESLYHNKGRQPIIVLSDAGIETSRTAFVPWNQIIHERVALKDTNTGRRGGNTWFLAFSHPEGHATVYLEDLSIRIPQLDLLLWLYRGRYEAGISSKDYAAGLFV